MSPHPVTTASDSSGRILKERLDRLERDLIRQRQRVDSTTTLTTIIGIIALVAVAGYAYYGYREISTLTNPETMVNAATQMIDDNLPQLRRRLEAEIIQSAPQWAGTLSKEALGQIPAGRKHLEKLVLENLDEGLAATRSETNQQFHNYITKNKEHLTKQLEELAKSPDLTESTFADLQSDLEKDLGVNFQADAAALLKELTMRNQNFKNLREGKNLNDEQQVERRFWMLARRIVSTETLDLSTTGLPEIGTSSTEPVSIKKSAGSKPAKRLLPDAVEDEKKGSPAPDKKKEVAPDSDKKKDASTNSDKKKDAAADSEKKKDTATAKPESKN
jgi:hypothetical protein